MGQKVTPSVLRLNINRNFIACWYADRQYAHLLHENIQGIKFLQSIFSQIGSKTALTHITKSWKNTEVHTFFCHPRQFYERASVKSSPLHLTPFFQNSSRKVLSGSGFQSQIFSHAPFVTKKQSIVKNLKTDLLLRQSLSFFTKMKENNLSHVQNMLPLKTSQIPKYEKSKKLDMYRHHVESILSQSFQTQVTWHPQKVNSLLKSAKFIAEYIAFQFEQNKSFRQIFKNLLKDIKRDGSILGCRISCAGRLGGAEMARVESKKYGQTSLHVFSKRIDYGTATAYTPLGLIGIKVWLSLPHSDHA